MASLIGFLITIVLFSPASYAKDPVNFGFKPEQCGISTSQELKFGDLGVAQVQLDLKMSPGPYHHPKVELLVNGLDIKKASLSWTTVPKKYFARPVSKSIQKERGRPYSFNKKGDKFISIHWGWLRSQHFVALLLYKKYMQLTVIDQSDKTHVADVSLTGTTASFRKMAWECHKESTREYLKAEKKYKKNPATTNSAGFGLTSHGIYELSLPKDLRSQEKPFLENSGFSVEEQESRLKKYIPIAKDKSEALKIIAKKGKGKKFKANSKRVLKEYGRIQQLWPQMIALYGESPTTGSLNILKNKNAELLKEIKATDLEIKRLYRDLQEPKSENLREQTFRLTPYERRVGEYDRFIIETKLSLDATQEKIKILGGILKTYLSWLEGKAQDLSVDLKPLSYVEIIEVRDQQKEKISRIEALGQLIEQLKGAIARLDDVEKASEKIPQAFTDYIKARSDWSLGKESVEASDVAISKLDDKYRGYLRNLFEPLNKKSEELVGMILTKKGLKNDKATRTAKVEKTIHKHLLKELYKVLDHALNEAGKALVAKTVCSSKNYKQKFNKDEYCLAVQNLDGDLDKELTRYYESLSPKATDEHLATYLEEVPKVWPKGHGPKVTYLIEKFKEELSAMSEIHRKKIRNAWYHIEFLRWRANASIKYAKRVAKQDPSQVVGFDSSFYISYHEASVKRIEGLEKKRQELAQKTSDKTLLDQARSAYIGFKKEFESKTKSFIDEAVSVIHVSLQGAQLGLSDENIFALDFSKCVFPLADAAGCMKNLKDASAKSPLQKESEEKTYLEITKHMLKSIKFRLNEMTTLSAEIEIRINELEEKRENYLVRNRIRFLRIQKKVVIEELRGVEAKILLSHGLIAKNKEGIVANETSEQKQRQELAVLVGTLEKIKAKMKPFQDKIKKSCSGINASMKQVEELDRQIYEILRPGLEISSPEVVSACQVPSVEEIRLK